MSDGFRFIEPRVDFLDSRTGKISRQWYLFLQGLYTRVGGSAGFSADDLALGLPDDAGVEELKADLYRLRDEVHLLRLPPEPMPAPDPLLPPNIDRAVHDQLCAELAGLREQVVELSKAVQALQQGINP